MIISFSSELILIKKKAPFLLCVSLKMKPHLIIVSALFSWGIVFLRSQIIKCWLIYLAIPCRWFMLPDSVLQVNSRPIQHRCRGGKWTGLHFSSTPNSVKPVTSVKWMGISSLEVGAQIKREFYQLFGAV